MTSATPPDESPWERAAERFLKRYLKREVLDVYQRYDPHPGALFGRSLHVSLWDLHRADAALAQAAVEHPTRVAAALRKALDTVDLPLVTLDDRSRPSLWLRFHMRTRPEYQVPPDAEDVELPPFDGVRAFDGTEVFVNHVGEQHLGRLVTMRGMVKARMRRVSEVVRAVFQCNVCGAFIAEDQDEPGILKKPIECYENQGGGGHDAAFKLITEDTRGHKSTVIDAQWAVLAELPENAAGVTPPTVRLHLTDDAIDSFLPGDRVRVTGVVQGVPERRGNHHTGRLAIHVEVHHVERESATDENLDMTVEDRAYLQRILDAPDGVARYLLPHVATGVEGHLEKKYAMLLSTVGGIRLPPRNGRRRRHQIHVLHIGDPGVAKTKLALAMAQLMPRHVRATGKGATVAGLTLAAVKDKDDESYGVEVGLLVLGRGGAAVLDEFHEFSPDVVACLAEPMQDQTVSTGKTGAKTTVDTDITLYLVANPKHMRWDTNEDFAEQLNIPANILSRLDAVYVWADTRDPVLDERVANTMLADRYADHLDEPEGPTASPDPADEVPPLPSNYLAKHLALARAHTPRVPRRIIKMLVDRYRTLRNPVARVQGTFENLTPRVLESLTLFTEANAKIHLRAEVTDEDVDVAVEIYTGWLNAIADKTGTRNADVFFTGESAEEKKLMNRMTDIVYELGAGTMGALRNEVLQDFVGEDDVLLTRCWERLVRKNHIYDNGGGRYRVRRMR